jgi:acyl-coenzyme A synthetase/AMP-(fatty) acid ligase
MIKVSGLKVASVELEKMIAGLPKVANCTVTESGFSLWEPPLIFLVPTDSELSETDIRECMLRFWARYKVFFVECGSSSIHPEGKLIKCRCIIL